MSGRSKRFLGFCLPEILLAIVLSGIVAQAQVPDPTPLDTPASLPSPTPSLERKFLKNIIEDQAFFWTMPAHLRANDAKWIVPLTLSTGGLIATDKNSARGLGRNQSRERVSRGISELGALYTTGAAATAFYLAGRHIGDERLRETGLLAFEATIDGVIVSQALKAISQRPRPLEDQGRGRFFHGGRSFPSGHAVNAWALATIVAHEYKDSRTIQILSYGLAGAVSVSRFMGCRHFLSSVLIGSAIGYGIGSHVFHTRHDSGSPVRRSSSSKGTSLTLVPH